MKEPIVLPFVFLLVFIAALAVFSLLDLFSAWGYSSGGIQAFTLGYAASHIPGSALKSLIPAVITALLFAGLRASRKPVSRLLVLVILLGAGYLVLVNGMFLLKGAGAPAAGAEGSARLYVRPRAFLRIGNSVVNAQSVGDAAMGGVLVYDADSKGPERFSVSRTGSVSVKKGVITIGLAGAQVSGAVVPASGRMFEPDPFTALFIRDMGVLTADFRRLISSAPAEFFLAAFALLFLCAASLVITRITRWPLVNALILIAAVRCYFLLYHFLSVTVAPEISKGLTDPLIARLFPSIAFIVLGVLMLVIDIIFVPVRRPGEEAV